MNMKRFTCSFKCLLLHGVIVLGGYYTSYPTLFTYTFMLWFSWHSEKYSFLIILFILVELAAGCFIFFDHDWKNVIPVDKTGNFDMIYSFLKENWRIAKWVALGSVVFEALLFTVALIVQSGIQDDYDSDDEYIGARSGVRQPLVNKQAAADPRVPNLDYRPIRNDAWSQRMRDKYGVDTFDPNRFQQATISPAEQRSRCTILWGLAVVDTSQHWFWIHIQLCNNVRSHVTGGWLIWRFQVCVGCGDPLHPPTPVSSFT